MFKRILGHSIISMLVMGVAASAAPPKKPMGVGVPLFTRRHTKNIDYAIESMKAQVTFMRSKDTLIRVYGSMSKEQLQWLIESLNDIPQSLKGYATDIYINHNLGRLELDGKTIATIVGLGGDGRIVLERNAMKSKESVQDILYHEMGHNYDVSHDGLGFDAPWGLGESISEYGSSSCREDFAEFFADVIKHFACYKVRTEVEWAKDPLALKKRVILSYLLPPAAAEAVSH